MKGAGCTVRHRPCRVQGVGYTVLHGHACMVTDKGQGEGTALFGADMLLGAWR